MHTSFQCQSHSLQLNSLKWLTMAHESLNERLCNKDICMYSWPLNSCNALDGSVRNVEFDDALQAVVSHYMGAISMRLDFLRS